MNSGEKIHVVVVGAGILGASIAYCLSRRNNVNVTVLEKSKPGSGASGHSFAWLNSFGKDPVSYHNLNCRSMDMWHRFANGLEQDIGFHCGGQLRWENTDEGAGALRQRVRQLQMRGYACRLISAAEMRQLEPGLFPGAVKAASLSQADGCVEPPKVVEACLEKARERGGAVQTQAPVTGMSVRNGSNTSRQIKAVRTPSDEIDCDVVVLAGGLHTTQLAAMAGVRIPQQESPGVVARTTPCQPVLNSVSVIHAPRIDVSRQDVHFRQASDGTLMIGQGSRLPREPESRRFTGTRRRTARPSETLLTSNWRRIRDFGARGLSSDADRWFPSDRICIIGTQSLYCGNAQRASRWLR